MAIFNNTTFTPVVEQSEEEIVSMYPNIMATAEGAYEIACEGAADIYKLMAGLYVSDVMIEQSVMEGAEAEPLIEGTIKEFLAKAKAKFIEIRDKVVAWFKKIFDNLKIRFASSKDFVEKYESRITEKAQNIKNFKPKHHEFNLDIAGEIIKVTSDMISYAQAVKHAEISGGDGFTKAMVGAVKGYKAENVTDLKKELKEKLTGRENDNVPVGASKIAEMVKYCKTTNEPISELTAIRDKNVKELNGIISELNGSGEKYEIGVLKAKISNYNTAVNAMIQLNAVAVGMVNEINREYVGILRALMLAKTESASDDEMMEETNTNSIFESAMSMI